jgi:hypothetical protein
VFHRKSTAMPKPTFLSIKEPYMSSPSHDVEVMDGQTGPIFRETNRSIAVASDLINKIEKKNTKIETNFNRVSTNEVKEIIIAPFEVSKFFLFIYVIQYKFLYLNRGYGSNLFFMENVGAAP